MNLFRVGLPLAVVALALALTCPSTAAANVPPPPDYPLPPEEDPLPAGVSAPISVTLTAEANGQAILVIPRKLIDRAGAAGAEAPAGASKSAMPAVVATVAGGGALSLGILLLGVYLVRTSSARARKAVAGTAAAVALFVGAGAAFADLLPFSPGARPPQEPQLVAAPAPVAPQAGAGQVKVVIVEEGDTIELTLPRTFLPKK